MVGWSSSQRLLVGLKWMHSYSKFALSARRCSTCKCTICKARITRGHLDKKDSGVDPTLSVKMVHFGISVKVILRASPPAVHITSSAYHQICKFYIALSNPPGGVSALLGA